MMFVEYYQKLTPGKGFGIFAKEFISAGTLVWKLTDKWDCLCGSPNCRHKLHWNDILKPEVNSIYKGHLPSWVQEFVDHHTPGV